ncbi:hypothetical protein ACPCXF_03575 [Lysinibacillus agricola]
MSEVAHRTPSGSIALCESEASATMFYLRESAQPLRKSTTRYGDETDN